MKFLTKNIYLILFLILSLFYTTKSISKDNNIRYTQENISNYFSGIILSNSNYSEDAHKHLNKLKFLKNNHRNFNIQFLRTLILLKKFDEAFEFSKNIWNENELFFEADLILGINYFVHKEIRIL